MKLVYFMKPIGMAGPIKIGCSKWPETRLKSLDIWSPYPLEIVATAEGDNTVENRLHWRFRKDRTHGEWFNASADLLNLIHHVRLNGTLPPLEATPSGASCRVARNRSWKNEKTALGRRLNRAEAWAYGWLTYMSRERRPERIAALCAKYLGANNPPLRGDDLAEMNAYIAHLHSLPCGKNSKRELELREASNRRWAEHNRRVSESIAA